MAMLTPAQLEQFHEDGFLVIDQLLDDDDMQPIWDEYSALLDSVAEQMAAEGRISSTYRDLPFLERYLSIFNEDKSVLEHVNISMPLVEERYEEASFAHVHCGKAVFELLTHPKVLDVVESVIGPEIYSNPIQHIRLKTPARQLSADDNNHFFYGTTSWHQDQSAVTKDALDTEALTVWIAMTDVPEERGCLVAMPGSHKKEVTLHCPGKTVNANNSIPAALLGYREGIDEPILLPVNRGAAILLTRYTEHGGTPNRTENVRWSFDLRYHPIGQPTGRSLFPGFVARSNAHPERVLPNHHAYKALWDATRAQIARDLYTKPIYDNSRWEVFHNHPVCA